MNSGIAKLHRIATKPSRLILGLMSGTSVDGLDMALCRFEGHGLDTKFELQNFRTVPYDQEFRDHIAGVFAKPQVNLERVCVLNPWVSRQYAEIILNTLSAWGLKPEQIDLIASHGQTIYHAPQGQHGDERFPNATLQIGDGDHLACFTNIITISDFRQKHLAMGGEGAPLAVYGDYLVFGDEGENRIMLNLGGVANLTYLPKTLLATEVVSTDVGPGNTMMDAYVKSNFPGQNYDKDAALALKGTVSESLLHELKQCDFFSKPYPTTTGPELFNLNYLESAMDISSTHNLSANDIMATLNKFTADMVVRAVKFFLGEFKDDFVVYASGGGIHNPLLMDNIAGQLPKVKLTTTWDLQVDPDAKEALLFAILANECVAGEAIEFGGNIPSTCMGKISLP